MSAPAAVVLFPAGTAAASREEVIAFYATGIPSAFLYGLAANPVVVAEQAAKAGATESETQELMLSLAGGVAALEALHPAADGKAAADITRFARNPGTARRA